MARSSRLPRPLRRLRDWLRGIERHSATRRGGSWTRATEWALVLSLPIGGVLAFALDEVGSLESREIVAVLRIGRDAPDAPVTARALPLEDYAPGRATGWSSPIPLAEVLVERRVIRHGWPFPSRFVTPPPAVIALPVLAPDERIPLRDGPAIDDLAARTGADLSGGLDAVIRVLAASRRHDDLVSDLKAERTVDERRWPATVALVASLWLLVFTSAVLAIRTAQAVLWMRARLRRRRIIARLRDGVCPDCRYDLRAERFPARCPECGRRIWS